MANIGDIHWRVRKIQQKERQGTLFQVYPTQVKGIMLQENGVVFTLEYADTVTVDDFWSSDSYMGVEDWVENKITSKEDAIKQAEAMVASAKANPRRKLPVTLEILDD